MTPAERKARQRARDRRDGWSEVTVRVPVERVADLRRFVASMTPPAPRADARQLDLLGFVEPSDRDMSR